MGTVKQTFTGDSKDLEAAYKRIERENVKLREELKKTAEEHKHGAEEAGESLFNLEEHLKKQVEHVVELAVEWGTVHKAMELAEEELERYLELQEKSLEKQKESGAARPQLYRNLAGLEREEMTQVLEGLDRIQRRHSIPGEHVLDQAMVQATSAAGGDWKQALKNVEVAARMVPDAAQHPDELASLAAGLGDMAKVEGEADPEKNLGFILGVMRDARVASISDATKNLVPSARSLVQHGASASQAFALINALGQSIIDPTGEQTGTGLIKFGEAVHKFFQPQEIEKRAADKLSSALHPALGRPADTATLGSLRAFFVGQGLGQMAAEPHEFAHQASEVLRERPELAEQFVARQVAQVKVSPDNLWEQIHYLQQHRDEAKEIDQRFVSEGAFEEGRGNFGRARTIAALRSLLSDPNSLMARQVEEFSANVPSGDEARELARRQVANLHADASVKQLEKSNATDVATEQAFTGKRNLADIQNARELAAAANDIVEAGAMTAAVNKWRTNVLGFMGIVDVEQEAIKQVKEAIFTLRYGRYHTGGVLGAAPGELDESTPYHFDAGTGEAAEGEAGAGSAYLTFYRRTNKRKLEEAEILEQTLEKFLREHEGGEKAEGEKSEAGRQKAEEEPAAAPERAVAEGKAKREVQSPKSKVQSPNPQPPTPNPQPPTAAARRDSSPHRVPSGWREESGRQAEARREVERAPARREQEAGGRRQASGVRRQAPDAAAEGQARAAPAAANRALLDAATYSTLFGAKTPGDRTLMTNLKGETDTYSAGELRWLIDDVRREKYDLEHRGHFSHGYGTWTVDDQDQEPDEEDRGQAADLGRAIAVLEKLLSATEEHTREAKRTREQSERQHREDQAAGRSARARTAGAGINGRE